MITFTCRRVCSGMVKPVWRRALRCWRQCLSGLGLCSIPSVNSSCKSALEWLGSRRMSDSLSLYPEVDMTTMQVIIRALLLAEATFPAWLEASRPDLSGLYQILENRSVQSGGAHSLVPQTSREEHDLLPQHTDTAPVMHTVTSRS